MKSAWLWMFGLVSLVCAFCTGCSELLVATVLSSAASTASVVSLIGAVFNGLGSIKIPGLTALLCLVIMLGGCAASDRAHVGQVMAYTAAGADDAGWDSTIVGNADLTSSTSWSPFGLHNTSKSQIIITAEKKGSGRKAPARCLCPWLYDPDAYLKSDGIDQVGRDAVYSLAALDDLGYTGTYQITIDPSGSITWSAFGLQCINKGSVSVNLKKTSPAKSKDESLCPWFIDPGKYGRAYDEPAASQPAAKT